MMDEYYVKEGRESEELWTFKAFSGMERRGEEKERERGERRGRDEGETREIRGRLEGESRESRGRAEEGKEGDKEGREDIDAK